MNAQKMTQKSLEALQAAQSLAVEYENQALCPEHLFCALLSQQDGLIPQLFQKMGAEPGNLAAAFAKKVGGASCAGHDGCAQRRRQGGAAPVQP